MCGRFVLVTEIILIAKEFNIQDMVSDLKPSYNIAPSQDIAVVMNEGINKLKTCRWGLIPSWAKDKSIGNKMINARAETLHEKPSFKKNLKKRRCLILADGFYEWKKDKKLKLPYYIYQKTKNIMAFAGLWDKWTSPDNEVITSCTIITTTANDLLKNLHHRMPVILKREEQKIWLDPMIQDQESLRSLLKPYPSEEMDFYEVSNPVNSPANNSPQCLQKRSLF